MPNKITEAKKEVGRLTEFYSTIVDICEAQRIQIDAQQEQISILNSHMSEYESVLEDNEELKEKVKELEAQLSFYRASRSIDDEL